MSAEQPLVTPEMKEYLNTQIETDEQVHWAGTTNVSGRMRRLLPLAVASIFLMFLCSIVSWNNPSRGMLVLLSLLVWTGIPAFVAWRQSNHLRHTLYAITNRRALILSVGDPKRTESYPPERIEFLQTVPKAGGRGDLYFTTKRGGRHGAERWRHGFLAIADVDQVARLMREALVRE